MLAYDSEGEAGLERVLNWLILTFSGSSYGWMWAGEAAARRFLEPICRDIRSGTLQKSEPYDEIFAAWCGA